MLCYGEAGARSAPPPEADGHPRNNQFGPLRLDTSKEDEFCIPSELF